MAIHNRRTHFLVPEYLRSPCQNSCGVSIQTVALGAGCAQLPEPTAVNLTTPQQNHHSSSAASSNALRHFIFFYRCLEYPFY